MFKNLFLIFLITFLISSCLSKKNKVKENNETISSVYDIDDQLLKVYKEGMKALEEGDVNYAVKKFNEAEIIYPKSKWAMKSSLMTIYAYYSQNYFADAVFYAERHLKNYPQDKNISYVHYLIAMCYFEQIEDQTLDGEKSLKALNSFNQIINRFPNSEYSKDSRQKIIFIKEIIAAKNMNIGMFYLKNKKYNAAMNRFKTVIEDHTTSKFIPEALFRLVEIYYNLGLVEEAEKTASVIGYNYPNSDWYKYAYKILNRESSASKDTLIKKLSNILKINE